MQWDTVAFVVFICKVVNPAMAICGLICNVVDPAMANLIPIPSLFCCYSLIKPMYEWGVGDAIPILTPCLRKKWNVESGPPELIFRWSG